MTVHGETGVHVLPGESQMALEHNEEPTAVVLARYRELLLAPFDALREDYQALGDERVARELDALLCAARGVPIHRPRRVPSATEQQLLEQAARLTDLERKALREALVGGDVGVPRMPLGVVTRVVGVDQDGNQVVEVLAGAAASARAPGADLGTAVGPDLDAWGAWLGCERRRGEADAPYREALIALVRGVGQ